MHAFGLQEEAGKLNKPAQAQANCSTLSEQQLNILPLEIGGDQNRVKMSDF